MFLMIVSQMRKDISDEEILALFREGYHLHQKKVKKYTYIVLRRQQEMHSLGPHTDNLWNRCVRLEYKFATEAEETPEEKREISQEEETMRDRRNRAIQRQKNIFDDYLREVERARGAKKFVACIHQKNLFCTFWKWNENSIVLRIRRELNEFIFAPREEGVKYFNDSGKKKFILKANPLYCGTCTAYEERR